MSRSVKFSVAGRVGLVVGLLLFLSFVTGTVSYVLTKRIEDDMARLAGVDDVRHHAVVDMRFRLAEIARTVFAYAVDRESPDKARARQSETEFDRFAATFMRLAATDEERGLGNRVVERFSAFRKVGAEIIAVTDRESAALVPVYGRTPAVDELVETKGRRPIGRGGARAGETNGASLGMGSDVAAATGAGGGVTGLAARKRELLTRFETDRGRIESLLGTQIAPLIRAARARTERSVNLSTYTVTLYLLVMSGFGVVIGSGAGILLVRRIVRPIRELKAGADAIGRGRFEHGIAVESDDEIGQLAGSIDRIARMAKNRRKTEDALREMAHHDALTKLPNRILFEIRLVEAMDNARRVDRMVALHFLDLDGFKDINDTLGHRAGDMLLQQIAERLKDCVRKSDTVARLGGDEFAVIQTNLVKDNDIAILAQRLNDALAVPHRLDGEVVYSGASIGITVYPHDAAEVEKLLKNADLALYRAKQEGRGMYQLYDPEMHAEIQTRKTLEQDLRRGLDRSEFFVEYQPKVDLPSGRIVGAEALLRWRHPERGVVLPASFIPVAEQSGLIHRLTENVLRDACRQATAWDDAGLPRMQVSVNLSPADFKRKDVVALVTAILGESGLDPQWLELEITEGMVMSDADSVVATLATLEKLHALGVRLAIDDFGTGFSSMSYLKRFPVDRLKIDRAFVRDILTDREGASVANVIIDLGHSLGLKVVAEGVESEEQLAFLRERRCDEAQGYCISPPLSADAFAEFVGNHMPYEAPRIAMIA